MERAVKTANPLYRLRSENIQYRKNTYRILACISSSEPAFVLVSTNNANSGLTTPFLEHAHSPFVRFPANQVWGTVWAQSRPQSPLFFWLWGRDWFERCLSEQTSESAQNDRKSFNCGLPVAVRVLGANQKKSWLWGRDWYSCYYLPFHSLMRLAYQDKINFMIVFILITCLSGKNRLCVDYLCARWWWKTLQSHQSLARYSKPILLNSFIFFG